MNEFVFSYPTKVYFGAGAAKKALTAELGKYGKTVLLAYGGGSVKRSDVKCILSEHQPNQQTEEYGLLNWLILSEQQ